MRRISSTHVLIGGICVLVLIFQFAAGSASAQNRSSTRPTATGPAADITGNPINFLLYRLSGVEESLKAIEASLKAAGYQIQVNNAREQNAQRGNALMNRNGGAPVPWNEFYGKTAKDFYVRDTTELTGTVRQGDTAVNVQGRSQTGPLRQIKPPDQFQAIYAANAEQARAAKEETARLGGQIERLLQRKRELELQQIALWTRIATTIIKERDLSTLPLYTRNLSGEPGDTSQHAAAILAVARFVQTMSVVARDIADDGESVMKDPSTALNLIKQNATTSQRDLTKRIAGLSLSDPAKQFAPIPDAAERATTLASNALESFNETINADKANDEILKQNNRGALQDALSELASQIISLDAAIQKQATQWRVSPRLDQPALPEPEVRVANTAASAPVQVAPVPAPSQGIATTSGKYKGNLAIFFSGDGLEVYVNGQRIHSSGGGVNLRGISCSLSPGDCIVLRVRSRFVNRNLRYAFIAEDPVGSFGGKPSTTVVRQLEDLKAPVPKELFIGSHPMGTQSIPSHIQEWDGAKLPQEAEWITLAALNVDYEMAFVVPNPANNATGAQAAQAAVQQQPVQDTSVPPGRAGGRRATGGRAALGGRRGNRGDSNMPTAPQPSSPQNSSPSLPAEDAPPAILTPQGTGGKSQAARVVDLLKLIDPQKDQASGIWSKDAGGKLSGMRTPAQGASRWQTIKVPYNTPAEYDLRIRFVRTAGNGLIAVICQGPGARICWVAGPNENHVAGLQWVNGAVAQSNPTAIVADRWITNGREQEVIVRIRRNSVDTFLDEKPAGSLKTDVSNVELAPWIDTLLGRDCHLAIGASPTDVITITLVEIAEISGAGSPSR